MTEAVKAAIEYVFQELNMHRIMANYMRHNQRSGNVLKRLGFVVEGYAREYLLINGQWEDHIFTSITNPHWKNPITGFTGEKIKKFTFIKKNIGVRSQLGMLVKTSSLVD